MASAAGRAEHIVNLLEKLAMRIWLKGKGKSGMGERFKAIVGWLNEVPGRKRAIGAALLAISAVLRVYGHHDAAETAVGFNEVVQSVVVPGCDLVGVAFAVIGLAHAKKKGQL